MSKSRQVDAQLQFGCFLCEKHASMKRWRRSFKLMSCCSPRDGEELMKLASNPDLFQKQTEDVHHSENDIQT